MNELTANLIAAQKAYNEAHAAYRAAAVADNEFWAQLNPDEYDSMSDEELTAIERQAMTEFRVIPLAQAERDALVALLDASLAAVKFFNKRQYNSNAAILRAMRDKVPTMSTAQRDRLASLCLGLNLAK